MVEPLPSMQKKWTVFIMFHNMIWDDLYVHDPGFDAGHYRFMKLGRQKMAFTPGKGHDIIREQDFPIWLDLPHYAEITGLYCVYRNRLHEGLDYIGFSHYDKEHRLLGDGSRRSMQDIEMRRIEAETHRRVIPDGRTDLTALIDAAIRQYEAVHISLESHDVRKIYDQHIVMDERYPDRIEGEGVNCIDRILQEYNDFFGTRHTLEDLGKSPFMNMCDCFVTPVRLFEKLMTFLCPVIESGRLDGFDRERKHRIQGNLLERYTAVFFALEPIDKVDLSTVHQFWRKVRPGFLKQILNRFTS